MSVAYTLQPDPPPWTVPEQGISKGWEQPPCISYTNVGNYYGPYAYCSLDNGVACTQHIQLPTHTCARA